MVAPANLATLVVAGVASAFMAWAIGAGSSGSTPFAPAVGANAIPVMRAGFYVGILGLAGAVFQGANVSDAIGRELILGTTLSPGAATVALLTAAVLVAIGVFAGYPIATAFTVTGAVIGTGLALGGAPAWPKYREIAALWVAVPFVGGSTAFGTAVMLRRVDVDTVTVPLLSGLVTMAVANIGFVLLGPSGESQSIATTVATGMPVHPMIGRVTVTVGLGLIVTALMHRDVRADPATAQRRFLLALGGLVAFSAGGSQVGLAVGPLLPLLGDQVRLIYILFGGGLGLLLGSWTGAPRMIKALAQDYSSLGPRRSIAALIPSFLIAQVAVFFGIPISFNEIIVSAIVGSGYAAGSADVSRRKMGYTVLAWIGSLALAFGLSYGAYMGLALL